MYEQPLQEEDNREPEREETPRVYRNVILLKPDTEPRLKL